MKNTNILLWSLLIILLFILFFQKSNESFTQVIPKRCKQQLPWAMMLETKIPENKSEKFLSTYRKSKTGLGKLVVKSYEKENKVERFY